MTCGQGNGHAWNKVKIGGIWYNWDMTNVGADTLTAKNMGKCLKSDEQIANKKVIKTVILQ